MIDHPLFPATEDETEAPDVERIHVTRLEKGGQVWCPQIFAAEELIGLDAVYALFGGGSYELIARSSKGGRDVISARRRYVIPGAPKPLVEDVPDASAAPTPLPVGAGPAAPSAGIWPAILALAPALIQAWLGSQKEHTAMMMTMMNQSQQMLLAMVQSQKADSQSFIQAMAKLNESEKATMAQFFGKLAEAKTGGGGGDIEALMAGLELGRDMAGKTAGDSGDGDLSQIAQLMMGMAALRQQQQPPQQAPQSQPSAPPPTPAAQG